MIESVETYLADLRKELAGCDPALAQDALGDAEEHLRSALEHSRKSEKEFSEAEALIPIIDKYGTPEEIAAAYREIEALTRPALAELKPPAKRPFPRRFISVITDPKAWGALLYLILSMITGIVYFSWAFIGFSLSLSLLILIIGLPFLILFLLSIRSIALIEGRIVEALLGVRMPRRSLFTNRGVGWWEQIKSLFVERRTWTAIGYMLIQLPLGLLYFTVFAWLLSTSLSFMASPILELIFDEPLIHLGTEAYHIQMWQMPFVVAAGFILLLASLHLAKLLGHVHGVFAKTLLVGAR